MKILVSGEGIWDMGVCARSQPECDGPDCRFGPMTAIIDQMVEKRMAFSPIEFHVIRLLPIWRTYAPQPKI